MSRPFGEQLAALAARLEIARPDLGDEHARWALYAAALGRAEEWPVVLELLGSEPVQPVVAAVVVRALEVVPPARRPDFVAALPEGRDRRYAATRARELAILDAFAAGDGPEFAEHWSTWLQLRAATTIGVPATLEALATAGATKRIRAAAGDRLRNIRPG
ncbi:hypothetical protein VSH64_44905 [Amycolatopsis rhabdoformis]|uniref:HEAT repeat domain-containing protein n=1 Tax=Amycolatopsis rhabdoformis TaxID=1448059 RepID=A0ABZ1I655_9PSEU|nr:hypothetical protein [Amycolatopsis rhabdoformis]WSE29857.1 hypothetical protein VSH64_44905 [Amycolatopsis rhabdoformis]